MSDDATAEVLSEPIKKRRGRKPKAQAPEPQAGLSGEQFEKLLTVLAASNKPSSPGLDLDALKEVLSSTSLTTAHAMERIANPSNKEHPGISCFSYPEGDKKKPRPVLPFQFFYLNYPWHMFPETQHWRELELACQVEPGEYVVMRKDFTPMQVSVKAERDGDNKITKQVVEFSVSREDKWKVPPQVVVLSQIVLKDGTPRQRFVRAMQEYMQMALEQDEPVGVTAA